MLCERLPSFHYLSHALPVSHTACALFRAKIEDEIGLLANMNILNSFGILIVVICASMSLTLEENFNV